MEQLGIGRQYTSGEITNGANPLTLYDRYGSMAYGVILTIIPEPELAQEVLIDLFASSELKSQWGVSSHTAGEIIRLARIKALAARAASLDLHQGNITSDMTNTTEVEKLVFDLSFRQGYTVEDVAKKLQVSQTNVLRFIHTYFKQLRSS
jgi:DNA-directed RNA polymerase specialized sigma subunit